MSLYDERALEYAEHAAGNIYNAAYERPAMQALLPDVRGKRVLDAGCAAGEHAEFLLERGAQVIAVDRSAPMIDLVRRRFGDAVETHVADLERPLSFLQDACIDLVFSSLTLHYLESWQGVLGEFRRILRPDGMLLFSTHHPAMTAPLVDDYFATELVRDHWTIGGVPTEVSFYHRPLQAILDAVLDAGFAIDRIVEPRLKLSHPPRNDDERRLAYSPWFLVIRASQS